MSSCNSVSSHDRWARALGVFAIGLLSVTGCGDTSDQGTLPQAQFDESVTELATDGRQPDFVDSRGNHFVWVQKVTAVPARPEVPALLPANSSPSQQPEDAQQLAEDLKPRLLKDGHEYTLAAADLDVAKKLLSGVTVAGTLAASFKTDRSTTDSAAALDVRQSAYVFGVDDRMPLACGQSVLYPATVSGLITGPSDCTGTLIGLHTVATAAHCLYSNGWLTTGQTWFSAGLDLNPNCPTYGHQFLANWAVIPGGFRNWNDTPYYDYAILDFSQYSPDPAHVVGGFAGTSSVTTGPITMYGYGPRPAPQPPYMELVRGGIIDGQIVSQPYDY